MVSSLWGSSAPDAPMPMSWYRVFLADGEVVAAFGEVTRVDDVVILNAPVGVPGEAAPATRPVTLPASAVDWARTDAYRDAVRRAHFDASDGARAYAVFTEDVAATLRDVATLPDPLERIRRLEVARARLAQWPAAHHGSRAEDVAATLSVLDDLLNGMRAAAGQQAFSLAITARTATVPAAEGPPLLPPPTLQDVVVQALGLASRVRDPAERLALLASASALLTRTAATDAPWAADARRQVTRAIKGEHRIARAYTALRTWALARTARLLARADVRGLLRLRQDVEARGRSLKQQRPAETAALLATLDARVEAARRHRLLLERWAERRPALQRYADVLGRQLESSAPLPRALQDIKALAGPDPALLRHAEGQVAGGRADAALLVVPDDARAVHGLWASALQMAARALQTRRAAVASGNLEQAWEASAAAAGALLLLQQLRADLGALTSSPSLPRAAGP